MLQHLKNDSHIYARCFFTESENLQTKLKNGLAESKERL